MVVQVIAGKIASGKRLWGEALKPTLLDGCFPPRCLACQSPVAAARTLCADCFRQVEFCAAPACRICGHPFAYAQGPEALCGGCMEVRPPYHQGWAVVQYDAISRPLITRLKYGDRTDIAPYCARLMSLHGQALLASADWLVPVPMHWRRLLARRFNQSLLLAQAIGELTGIPVLPDGLQRVRHTPPQASLPTRAERLKNVRGVFRVHPKRKSLMEGANVVLIDDVTTTGATLHVCCRALRRAKVAQLNVLTLARRMVVE